MAAVDPQSTAPDTFPHSATLTSYALALGGQGHLTTGALDWLQWVSECLHILECDLCSANLATYPAPPPEVRAWLRSQSGRPRFEVFLRRLAGFAGSPIEQRAALDVYDTLHPTTCLPDHPF